MTNEEWYEVADQKYIQNGKITKNLREYLRTLNAGVTIVLFDTVTDFVYMVQKDICWDGNLDLFNRLEIYFFRSRKDWDAGINHGNKSFTKMYGFGSDCLITKGKLTTLHEVVFQKMKHSMEKFKPTDLLYEDGTKKVKRSISSEEYYKIITTKHIKNGKITKSIRDMLITLEANKSVVLFDDVTGFVYRIKKDPAWGGLSSMFNELILYFYKSRKDWDAGINFDNQIFSKTYGQTNDFDITNFRVNNMHDIEFFSTRGDEKSFYPRDLITISAKK